jgi:hypothetical protein
LKSNFDDPEINTPLWYRAIKGTNITDVTLSNFTVTSTFNRTLPTSAAINNSEGGGPTRGIYIGVNNETDPMCSKITIQNVAVERFRRIGIAILKGCHDVVVYNHPSAWYQIDS